MPPDPLARYINDHLAGSVVAIEVLEHLAETSDDSSDRDFFRELDREITEDQETLRGILHAAGREESGARKAGAWLGEKVGRLKLQAEGSPHGTLHELEALEALCLGVLGKAALWRALRTAGDREAVHGIDFDELERRAQDQHARLEARRLEVARSLFTAAVKP